MNKPVHQRNSAPAKTALADMQQRFANALLSFNAIDEAIPLLKVKAVGTSQLTEAELAQNRLAFYRGNLTAIWKQTLSNAYPVLLQLVGEEFFEQLARAYGRAHPSQSGNLNFFGADFSQFVANNEHCADYPYFSDVIALEWLVHQAYYAQDVEVMSLVEVLAQVGEKFAETKLQWNPTAHLFQSPWNAVSIWLAHQTGADEAMEINLEQLSFGVVTRPDWHVQLMPLTQAEFIALQALAQSASVGTALEMAVEADVDFNISEQLNKWFNAGLFSGIQAV
jgi:hypothetical protein